MSLNKFKLSESHKTGIWFDFDENIKFKLAHSGRLNARAQSIFEVIHKPYRHQINTGSLSDAKADELLIEFFTRAIILDWKVVDENGVNLEFNEVNVKAFLAKWPVLFDHIKQLSGNVQNFLEQEIENVAKN